MSFESIGSVLVGWCVRRGVKRWSVEEEEEGLCHGSVLVTWGELTNESRVVMGGLGAVGAKGGSRCSRPDHWTVLTVRRGPGQRSAFSPTTIDRGGLFESYPGVQGEVFETQSLRPTLRL